jgi:two-component system, chemotaxis family, protein-glutamate methylesterase/glutaminase
VEKIKLLLVDDSSLIRKIIKSLFKDDNEIEVIDEATNGKIALEKISSKEVDVVLLDYEMPEMNGLEFLEQLKTVKELEIKPAVLVFSSLTNSGSKQTIECLLAGAKDYIPKPSSTANDPDLMVNLKSNIRDKIILIGKGHRRKKNIKQNLRQVSKSSDRVSSVITKNKPLNMGLVVIGSSTGGPAALEQVLKGVPSNFRYPILIVQHMPENFTTILANTLSKNCNIKVNEVKEKTIIKPGEAYLASGGKHMVMLDPQTVDSIEGPLVNFCIPAVDVLYESVAKHYKRGLVSIILTGMGKDGCAGVRMLKDNLDCFSIAQDEISSVVWAMPRAVHEAGLSDMTIPVEKIGEYLKNV